MILGFHVHAESQLNCLSPPSTEPESHNQTGTAPLKTTPVMFAFRYNKDRKLLESGRHTPVDVRILCTCREPVKLFVSSDYRTTVTGLDYCCPVENYSRCACISLWVPWGDFTVRMSVQKYNVSVYASIYFDVDRYLWLIEVGICLQYIERRKMSIPFPFLNVRLKELSAAFFVLLLFMFLCVVFVCLFV